MAPATTQAAQCSLCAGRGLQRVLEIPRVAVNCITLWPSREEALRCPTGRMELTFCPSCGAISNPAFDDALVEYDPTYNNSLHFSPSFQSYASELAAYLVDKYGLRGKRVLEIGCGNGGFLAMLCKAGNNRGLGFDPAFDSSTAKEPGVPLTIVSDYYSERYASAPADFVCCRQVLEHIANPRAFLTGIRRAIGARDGITLFFEVPDASFMLREAAIWDIIYEHCFYYAAPSLIRVLSACGFEVISTHESFGGQYLCVEARARSPQNGVPSGDTHASGLEFLAQSVAGFAERYRTKVLDWSDKLKRIQAAGQRMIVWGAGAKGTTFLNIFHTFAGLDYIVDINPHKQGRFVPVTGQKVVPPDFLRQYRPDLVAVMNPNYSAEIATHIRSLGVKAELLVI